MTPGTRHWLRRLRPLAQRGYLRGELTSTEVVLYHLESAAELHLPRGVSIDGWIRADVAVPATEEPDPNDPELRGLVYSMQRPGTNRMELSA